ncbi:MAG TPA: APC family permease [Gaiellaceae bacterium]|nr:APC family permease [Gaiellaceae bacterium]
MAEAAIEERQLLKALRWYDGFVIALANPGFLLGSLGYTAGDLGGWGSLLLWGISAFLAVFIMTLYSELAAMFPDKPGGFPLYAHEGWRKYSTLVGPVATFGYWIGWSVVLSVFGIFIGQIVQGAWFPGAKPGSPLGAGYFSLGDVDVGLPHFIAAGLIVSVWLFNVFGVRVGVGFGYLAGALLMIPLFCFMFLGYFTGDFHSSNLTWGALDDSGQAWGGLRLALVWLWIMSWSAWGVDTCATFAPEYKDTVNDTKLALRSAALFSLAVYTLLPLGLIGSVGEKTVASFDYVGALNTLTGSKGATDFFVVVICASFILSMNTATADGGRALYGIARDDMTIKQLYHLNRFHVPGRAMTLDMVVNLCFVFFVGNIFGILAASNIGYVLAHFFALTGYILLRKDRPNWPRPIKLPAYWTPIAGFLALCTAVFTVVGIGWFQTAAGGYGQTKEKVIGLAVLVIAVLLFLFRRIVQDGEAPHWREEPPAMPEGAGAPSPGLSVPAG